MRRRIPAIMTALVAPIIALFVLAPATAQAMTPDTQPANVHIGYGSPSLDGIVYTAKAQTLTSTDSYTKPTNRDAKLLFVRTNGITRFHVKFVPGETVVSSTVLYQSFKTGDARIITRWKGVTPLRTHITITDENGVRVHMVLTGVELFISNPNLPTDNTLPMD